MKFTINPLKNDLKLLSSIADTKSGLDALSSILIEGKGNKLRLTASDLDNTLQLVVEADVIEEGKICLPVGKFKDILVNSTVPVTFTSKDNNYVEAKSKAKYRIAGISPESFPAINAEGDESIVISSKDLKFLITHTSFCTSPEESRFALSGVELKIDDGVAVMAASDSHRLAVAEVEVTGDDFTTLITKKTLTEVSKFEGDIKLTNSLNHVIFQCDNKRLISRKLIGTFPDYEKFVPKNNPIKVKSEGLLDGLKQIATCLDDSNNAVNMDIKKNKIILSTQNQEGQAEVKVQGSSNEEISILVSHPYMVDYLNISENPVILIKDSNSQILLEKENSYYMVGLLRK